jgi:alpha-glucosidase
MLALPGGAYVYQGEELGLWQVEDLPFECLQDPMVARSGGEVRGRDGCRVPLPGRATSRRSASARPLPPVAAPSRRSGAPSR